jgi:hypothetical protein
MEAKDIAIVVIVLTWLAIAVLGFVKLRRDRQRRGADHEPRPPSS